MAKSTEPLDYQRLAQALLQRMEANARSEAAEPADSGPAWFEELLEALAPLKGLSPARGKLTRDQSAKLADIQRALARTDLSNAAPERQVA